MDVSTRSKPGKPVDQIKIKTQSGEVLTIVEDVDGEILITSTNDDFRMVIRPSYSNQFGIRFVPR